MSKFSNKQYLEDLKVQKDWNEKVARLVGFKATHSNIRVFVDAKPVAMVRTCGQDKEKKCHSDCASCPAYVLTFS